MKNKKVLFVYKRYYTNKDLVNDRFGRFFYFPKYLSDNGYVVKAIAADYKSIKDQRHDISGFTIYSLSLRISTFPRYCIKALYHLIKFRPDVIVAGGDSHFGLIGLFMAKLIGAKFYFDVYDAYYLFGTNRIPFMKSFFKWSVSRADGVFYASKRLMQILQTVQKNQFFIPNGVDTTVFKKISMRESRSRFEICEESIVVGYFGSMEKTRGIEDLISACEILSKEKKVILLLAGHNENIDFSRYTFIFYKGLVKQSEIPYLINSCDVVVLPYRNDPIIGLANSCKTVEYVACEKPIVTSDADNFLSNYPEAISELKPYIYKAGSIEGLVEAIKNQLNDKKVLNREFAMTWESIGLEIDDIIRE